MRKFTSLLLTTVLCFAFALQGCQGSGAAKPQDSLAPTAILTGTHALTSTVVPSSIEATASPVASTPTVTPYPQPNAVLSPDNALQMLQLARLGKGSVRALAYSADGHYLAAGTSIGIVIYDTETWAETLVELENGVRVVEFSPRGDLLAVGLEDGTIELRRAPAWSVAQSLVFYAVKPFVVDKNYWQGYYQGLSFQKNTGDITTTIGFAPDGETVAAGSLQGTVKAWHVPDGTLLKEMSVPGLVEDIAFSPDGKAAAIAARDVTLWQIPGWEQSAPLESPAPASRVGYFENVAFAPDGKSVIGWSGEFAITWQTSNGKILRSFEIRFWTGSVSLSPDGQSLAVATGSFEADPDALNIWDTATGKLVALTVSQPDLIATLAFSSDRSTLAAAFRDGRIEVLDTARDTVLQTLEGFPANVDDVRLSPDGSQLLAFSLLFQHPILQVRSLRDGTVQKTIDLNAYGAQGAKKTVFSPDGSLLAVGSKDLQLWDFEKGTLLQTFKGDQEWLYSNIADVVFSTDGKTLVYSFDFGGITVATTAGDVLRTLDKDGYPGPLCLFRDNKTLMAGGDMRYWDLESGKLIKQLPNPGGIWYFFTPGCDLFASMTWDGHFRVLRNTGKQLGERVRDFDLRAQNIYFTSPVAFSPDGTLVAVQEAIGKIRIFDLKSGETLAVLSGHKNSISGLTFSLEGKLLISSSLDGTIRLWGLRP